MRFFYLIFFISTTIISCANLDNGNNNQGEKNTLAYKRNKIESSLGKKYDIGFKWDTVNYKYSIIYDTLIQGNYQLLNKNTIYDIYKKGNSNYISLESFSIPTFFFELKINEKEVQKILDLSPNQYTNILGEDLIFVLETTDVKKIERIIKCSTSYEGESSYVDMERSMDFHCKGEVIAIKIIRNI